MGQLGESHQVYMDTSAVSEHGLSCVFLFSSQRGTIIDAIVVMVVPLQWQTHPVLPPKV